MKNNCNVMNVDYGLFPLILEIIEYTFLLTLLPGLNTVFHIELFVFLLKSASLSSED